MMSHGTSQQLLVIAPGKVMLGPVVCQPSVPFAVADGAGVISGEDVLVVLAAELFAEMLLDALPVVCSATFCPMPWAT